MVFHIKITPSGTAEDGKTYFRFELSRDRQKPFYTGGDVSLSNIFRGIESQITLSLRGNGS